MSESLLARRMNIRTIVWPIFIEHLLRMSMMTLDVLMLSRYSDDAVAAVGLMGMLLFFLMLSYMIVSTGSAILIGQNLGAKRLQQSQEYAHTGFFLSLLMSLLVGMLFYFGSDHMVALYDLEPAVADYALTYIFLVGTCSAGMSVSIMLSTILRAHGYSKSPMMIQLLSGMVNAVGNYLALFAPFGLPVSGVTGVAIATIISQFFAAVACLWMIRSHRIAFSMRHAMVFNGERMLAILRLGIPNAGEGLSYNLAQVVIMFFVAKLGTSALTAMAIAQTLARWIFVFSLSLGQGTQILSSYLTGHNKHQHLKRRVYQYCIVGMLVSLGFALMVYGLREPLASFFSEDRQVQAYIMTLLMVALLLEPGRAINLVVISALKGAADVIFPVKVGIISMWCIGVLFAYLFGLHWGWGLAGIWLGVAMDEWFRGCTMLYRWHNGRWMRYSRITLPASSDEKPASGISCDRVTG